MGPFRPRCVQHAAGEVSRLIQSTDRKERAMGYGLVGILVIVLLVVLIVYFARRA